MSHTNSTANLSLPQFIGTDKPTWLSDVNGAFAAIDSYAGSNDAALAITDGKADTAIADASNAVTTAGNAATTAGNAAATATAANTVAGNALTVANGINSKVGVLTDLTTTDKSTIVNAINEVNATVGTVPTAAQVSYNNTGSGLTAANVQDAIDELAQGNGHTETVLYTNPDSTQAMASVALPLSDDVTDYDIIRFEYLEKNDNAGYYVVDAIVSKIVLGTSFVDFGYISGATFSNSSGRRATFTDATTVTVSTGYSGGNADTSVAIPYRIIGIKN